MAGPHQPERAATTDLPNQINYVCMYFPSQDQACTKIYVVFFEKELNILCMAIDVLDIFQLSDVYQMKIHARPESG